MNFVENGLFPEADEAWLPTYLDVQMKYPTFGWQSLQVDTDCPMVISRFDTLRVRFEERYANRMISSETLQRWQVRLQNRFDEVVRRYERAYNLYARYEGDMDADVLPGETYTENEKIENSTEQGGSDSSESENRNIDTPDSIINQNPNYADSLSSGNSTVKYGRTDKGNSTRDLTRTRTLTGQDLMLNINGSIDGWRDIDTSFVGEFENLFMNIWWY